MRASSLPCHSSNSSPPPPNLSIPAFFALATFTARAISSHNASTRAPASLNLLRNRRHGPPPLNCNATPEIFETSKSDPEFVEVGYISSVHGLQGEICVKPDTGFPELRFSKPGRRWLRKRILGREIIEEVELVGGRDHPGKKGWILKFSGIDTLDMAKEFIGSTVLVKEDDRPELQDGEFYSRDLFGMRVFLKETGELVGIVVKVFNTGASDLLQVHLVTSNEMLDASGKLKPGTGVSLQHVWVPFVEAIVPIVDIERREMQITPPEGLLTLNLRSDVRSKKERRQLEWKRRQKFQRSLIAAKKKLREMRQQHVLHGFEFGDKAQKSFLAEQIVGLDSGLLELALQNIVTHSNRWEFSEFMSANSSRVMKRTLKLSEELTNCCSSGQNLDFKFLQNGFDVTSKGKIAVVVVVNGERKLGSGLDSDLTDVSRYPILQRLLHDGQNFVKMENRASVPLIVVCPARESQYLRDLFSDNGHFDFDSQKTWFLEEQMLPVVSSSDEAENKYKILMKSPWEMRQSPVGSGGVIPLLSSNGVLEKLGEMGIDYIEICSAHRRQDSASSVLLGFMQSHQADVGIQTQTPTESLEPLDDFDVIFSMRFMMKLTKLTDKLQFNEVLMLHAHVEMVEREWVDVVPSSPNSFELQGCIFFSALNACSSERICILETVG